MDPLSQSGVEQDIDSYFSFKTLPCYELAILVGTLEQLAIYYSVVIDTTREWYIIKISEINLSI